MAMKNNVNSPMILTIGIISGLLLLVVAFGVQAWFNFEQRRELTVQWDENPNQNLADMRKRQLENIGTYRWADKDKKTAAIPVDEAMRLLVENHGKVPATQPAR